MNETDESYNLAAIRKLLLESFRPASLRRFCQDQPLFRPIVDEFGPGMGLTDMVDRVVDYCENHLRFPDLLKAIHDEFPGQYARFEPYIETDLPAPKTASSQSERSNSAEQCDAKLYMTGVEEWAERVGLDDWLNWSSYVFSSGRPTLAISRERQLAEVRPWLLTRIWPGQVPELEASFDNFGCVLGDFLEVFHRHSIQGPDGKMWNTEAFYKSGWNFNHQDVQAYNDHTDLVQDLMLELTRAANYVCDMVRRFVCPTYRFTEGALLVQIGPVSNFQYITCRPEYRGDERQLHPYPGLQQFLIDRSSRDYHFGGVGSKAGTV